MSVFESSHKDHDCFFLFLFFCVGDSNAVDILRKGSASKCTLLHLYLEQSYASTVFSFPPFLFLSFLPSLSLHPSFLSPPSSSFVLLSPFSTSYSPPSLFHTLLSSHSSPIPFPLLLLPFHLSSLSSTEFK